MSGYVIKVTIEDTSPPVWRRILIPEKIDFGDLHKILQIAFGWEDRHPHEFTFSQYPVRITDERASGSGDLLEDEFEVDDLLRVNKWLRYTYGSEEDWKHKIVLEKVEEDHDRRYAIILKAKGDNFGEDSGGAFGDRHRVEFSMEETNSRLSGKTFGSFTKRVGSVKIQTKPSRPSKMEDRIRAWEYFDLGEEGYEEKTASDKSCVEILQDLSLREIKDYCKYLQIPKKSRWNKKDLAQIVYDTFVQHPEYLLYILEKEEFEELLRFCGAPEGRLTLEDEGFTADKYMSLGLMDIQLKEGAKGGTISYALAEGAEIPIGLLKNEDWKAISREIRRDGQKILDCLQIYGIMEVGACCDICRDTWKLDLEREDFRRLLYWYCRANGHIRTVEQENGLCYAMLSGIDIEKSMAYFFLIDGEIDYRKLTWEEVLDYQKGMILAERYWVPYVRYMEEVVGLGGEELDLWMDEERLAVMCGATSTEIMENVCGVFPMGAAASWVELWFAVMDACMGAGLFILKGHSRSEYERLTGKKTDFLPVIDKAHLKDPIKWDTHIYQMPEDIQHRVYQAYQVSSAQRAGFLIRNILKDMPDGNLEIVYMLAVCQITDGRLGLAEDTIKKFLRSHEAAAEDPSFSNLLETIGRQKQNDSSATYRRADPKVGRNDLCPCGSGKKYKKCCGKGE